jgi:hypothetical protein
MEKNFAGHYSKDCLKEWKNKVSNKKKESGKFVYMCVQESKHNSAKYQYRQDPGYLIYC